MNKLPQDSADKDAHARKATENEEAMQVGPKAHCVHHCTISAQT